MGAQAPVHSLYANPDKFVNIVVSGAQLVYMHQRNTALWVNGSSTPFQRTVKAVQFVSKTNFVERFRRLLYG
jgi:hypothetical protein